MSNFTPEYGESYYTFISRCLKTCTQYRLSATVVFNDLEIRVRYDSCLQDLCELYDLKVRLRYTNTQLETALEVAQKVADRVDELEKIVKEQLSTQDGWLLDNLCVGDTAVFSNNTKARVSHIGSGPNGMKAVWFEMDEIPFIYWADGIAEVSDCSPYNIKQVLNSGLAEESKNDTNYRTN